MILILKPLFVQSRLIFSEEEQSRCEEAAARRLSQAFCRKPKPETETIKNTR